MADNNPASLRVWELAMRQNMLLLAVIFVVSVLGFVILHDGTGLWSLLLMLFWLGPKSDDKEDEVDD